MARKTKEEALQTRQIILDAAQTLFRRQGVSRTSLQQIAQEANVTRGAIYWHFSDKLALFQALLDRATLPCDEIFTRTEQLKQAQPIQQIETLISELVRLLSENEQIRNMLDIVFHKVELVDEFAVMSERYLRHLNHILGIFAELISRLCKDLQCEMPQEHALTIARGLNAVADGLSHAWVHAPESFDLYKTTMINAKIFLLGIQALATSHLPLFSEFEQ